MVKKHTKTKITTRLVESLKAGESASDTHLPGYHVRCQKKAKIYFVRKYANGQRHFITISEHAVLGLTKKSKNKSTGNNHNNSPGCQPNV
ncbi:unnamed protein product [Scytosiphon promiscuus]